MYEVEKRLSGKSAESAVFGDSFFLGSAAGLSLFLELVLCTGTPVWGTFFILFAAVKCQAVRGAQNRF